MKIVTVPQMVAMEEATDAAGFTYDQMMAAAGAALADSILEHAPFAGLILFLIGPGNNGGDGLVACALLQQRGHDAIAYGWKRRQEDDPLVAAVTDRLWAEEDAGFERLQELLLQADVLVDALLGTGNTRPIGGSLAELLTAVNDILAESRTRPMKRLNPALPASRCHRPLVIACDCPSGLFCDTGEIDPLTLPADRTITFALPKSGHFLMPGAAACGDLTIADIGIDRNLAPDDIPEVLTGEEIAALLPARPVSAHKGTFGKALIVAGSANYPGAAALASLSAHRAGCGLVHLASPAAVGHVVASQCPEPVHTVLPSDMGALTADAIPILTPLFENHQALLLGPGLGADKHTVEFVSALLTGKTPVRKQIGFLSPPTSSSDQHTDFPPLIVDADGLNAIAQLDEGPAALPAHSLLTPHPGEMGRLTGLSTAEINKDRWQISRRFAAEWDQIVILKGAYTVIAHPDGRLRISPFADAALATAGSGDVLAGTIVGLMAQGLNTWDAACCGVYLHGLAGSLAAKSIGPALLASDISKHLPDALKLLKIA